MSPQIPSLNGRQVQINSANVVPMQGQSSEAVVQAQQAANNSYLANRAKASQDANPATTLGLTTAIGYGIGQGMDVFNKKCAGDYDKSFFGKLGGWGDKFSTNTKLGRAIESGLQKISSFIETKSSSSKILYSLKNHSTMPAWKFVKQMGMGMQGFLGSDTENIFETFLEPIKNNFQKLEQYGMTQDEIRIFKQSCTGTAAEVAQKLQEKELEKLGASASEIAGKTMDELRELAKELKAKKLGFADLDEYKSLKGKFIENPEKIKDVLSKADKDIKISIWRGNGSTFAGRLKSHLFGRTVSLSEYYNKYLVILGKGNKSYLGRMLPKAMAWITEGGTNRFAGGKLAPFMQAFFFADMVYHAIKAPAGEHIKTLAERVVNDFTYFIGGIVGILAMHKVGGFKYLGTNEAGREAYRAALKLFNEQVKAKAFATKADYKAAGKAVDALLNTDGLKWYQKILQKAACIINMGNEHKLAYRSQKLLNNNFVRRLMNTNIIGVPLRVIIPMFIISPFLAKLTTKAAHMIFGRPTHSVLDEDEEEVKQNEQNSSVQNSEDVKTLPKDNSQQQVSPLPKTYDPNSYSDTNLIKDAINHKNDDNAQKHNVEPIRRYIPSSECNIAKVDLDTTAYNDALAQADNAEKAINEILSEYYK